MMKTFFKQALYAILLVIVLPITSAYAADAPALPFTITGIDGKILQNAEQRLTILEKSYKAPIPTKTAYDLLEQGSTEIKAAVKPFGYFKATVSRKLTWDDAGQRSATYHVNLGPQLHVTELIIRITGPGKDDPKLLKTLAQLPLKEGSPFDTPHYEKTKSTLLNTAQELGYLNSTLTNDKIVINLDNYLCAITIVLNTGSRFYFGQTTFSKIPLSEKLLRRYLTFKPGQPFSYDKLLRLQQNLTHGGYFDTASVVPQIKKAKKQHVPIDIKLKMQKKHEYKFGIGYGTNTGIRGTIGYSSRWINQYGHRFNALFQLSQIQQNIGVQYVIPGKNPSLDQYLITANYMKFKPKKGESISRSIGLSYVKNYILWQRTLAINYQVEKFRVDRNVSYKESKLLMPELTLTRVSARNQLHVDNGTRFNITTRGASARGISTVSFIQFDAQFKLIQTILKNNRFIFRADYGYTIVHDLSKLPLTKRFYAGGIQSVRGYSFQGLGPGRFLLVGSAEYQRRIVGNWYAAVFYDAGNAMDHFNEPLERGAGGGIVWQSPIGAVQLYVARALNDKDHPLRIEFSLGPDL